MENALLLLDELKDKCLHHVDHAIEVWDYGMFAPDKRVRLLSAEMLASIDREQSIEGSTVAITPLSPSGESVSTSQWIGDEDDIEPYLKDQEFIKENGTLRFEAKIILMCTPRGGINGVPGKDIIDRFLDNVKTKMNPFETIAAFKYRLVHQNWQVRSKSILLLHTLVTHESTKATYLPLLQQKKEYMGILETSRLHDYNALVKERARILLSLLLSDGKNDQLLPKVLSPKNPVTLKQHFSNKSRESPKNKTQIHQYPKAIDTNDQQKSPQSATSPRVAKAALASWKRRSTKNLTESIPANDIAEQIPDAKQLYIQGQRNPDSHLARENPSHITMHTTNLANKAPTGHVTKKKISG